MPANNNDGQKRYERFIELVKAAYIRSLKTENIYKIGQDLWQKEKHDPDEYQQVVNALKSCSAKQKRNTINFWAKAASKHRSTLDPQNSTAGKSITEISDHKDTEQIPLTKVLVVDKEEEESEGESFSYILIFYFCMI